MIADLLALGRQRLTGAGVDNPGLDAEVLAAFALGTDRAGLYIRLKDEPTDTFKARFLALIERRAARVPLQHITGQQEFYGLTFQVGPDVLIPRPETELLVEEAITRLRDLGHAKAADIGTGSGAIAVALAANLPGAKLYAVDSSGAALKVAMENAAANGVVSRISFLTGNLLAPLETEGLAGGLDLIASNPPYIPSGEIPGLQPEVLFEPRSALDGGPDGLDVIRCIIRDAPGYLKPGGTLLVEIGFGQGDAVTQLVESQPGLEFEKLLKDFADIERVLVAKKR